ncbi:hypothetical protein PVK06_018289 [Gossypium arboreum]|uniref:Disease resistance RPP13-like protein 1 n=1 Tax=Gossypium arboreum TaxID=29729 RepID=A0ABR0Q5X3_GOSAR|nr:hypothetical protein PVK06_018289 [Gossypium arboreum]
MSVFGEAALSAFLELLSAKLLDSVLNLVADHRQVHQQLKLWQSILPEIKAVLNHAEEKQIKDEGVKNWLDDLQDLAYDVDDILDEFAYQELRLKLQKTQAQASTSKVFYLTNVVLEDLLPKLSYLRVLFLAGGADSIERMPSGFDQLTKLQMLSNFVIGEGDGHLIRELKILSNLRGNFCLSGLENVNGQDAREAKLNEKLGIDGLGLQWGAVLKNSTKKKEVEERVLDFLHPQKKLEQLIIENYGGVKFSSWIADSSFKNLSDFEASQL